MRETTKATCAETRGDARSLAAPWTDVGGECVFFFTTCSVGGNSLLFSFFFVR